MYYNDLHVFDATGAELPAVMLRTHPNHLAIVVDDAGPVAYRTPGIAVGTPDDSGGVVQLLQWVP